MNTIIQLSPQSPSYEALRWLALAVAWDTYDRGDDLKHICVTATCAVATDGHRIHLVETPVDLKPGLYRVKKRPLKELWLQADTTGIEYRDVLGVFPDISTYSQVPLDTWEPGDQAVGPWENYARIVRTMRGNSLDARLLADLLPMHTAYVPWLTEAGIVFYGGGRKAVLMPVRMEPWEVVLRAVPPLPPDTEGA